MSRISRICTIFNGLFTSFQFQIHVTVFHTSSTQLSRALYKQHHKSRSPPRSPNARCIVRSHHPAPNIRCTSWVAKLRSSDQRCLPASTKERPHLDASGHVSHVQKPKTKTSSHAHRQSTHGRHTAHELTCLRSSDRFRACRHRHRQGHDRKTRFSWRGVAAVQPWNLRKKDLNRWKNWKIFHPKVSSVSWCETIQGTSRRAAPARPKWQALHAQDALGCRRSCLGTFIHAVSRNSQTTKQSAKLATILNRVCKRCKL